MTSFNDGSIGFEANRELARVRVQYTDIVNMVLVDHREVHWVESELFRLRFESEEFECDVQRLFAPHCTSGLYTLEFHCLDHRAENLRRSGGISFMEAAAFEHFNVLIEQPYRRMS